MEPTHTQVRELLLNHRFALVVHSWLLSIKNCHFQAIHLESDDPIPCAQKVMLDGRGAEFKHQSAVIRTSEDI